MRVRRERERGGEGRGERGEGRQARGRVRGTHQFRIIQEVNASLVDGHPQHIWLLTLLEIDSQL